MGCLTRVKVTQDAEIQVCGFYISLLQIQWLFQLSTSDSFFASIFQATSQPINFYLCSTFNEQVCGG